MLVRLRLLLLAPWRVSLPALLALCAVGAAAGGLLAFALTRGGDEANAQRPAAPRPEAVSGPLVTGDVALQPPDGITRVRDEPAVRGLDRRDTIVLRGYGKIEVAQLPAETPSGLPSATLAGLDGAPLPAPQRVDTAGLDADRYANVGGVLPQGVVDLYVAPTTLGPVTIACHGHAASRFECERVLEQVRLQRGRPLPPSPEASFLVRLPGAVAQLNSDRRTAREALAAARTPPGRARAASRLSDAHRRAADTLAPVVPPQGGASDTVAQLRGLQAAYARLSAAAGANDRRRYVAAAGDVKTLDQKLQRALRGWERVLSGV